MLISRALDAVAEAVQNVTFTMDSVFLGPSERLTIQLNYPHDPSLFVSELLDWVSRVASEEGPRLIQDAGKDGAIAFAPILDTLRRAVRGALIRSVGGEQDPKQQPLPPGYSTARVQLALKELANQLDDAFNLVLQRRVF